MGESFEAKDEHALARRFPGLGFGTGYSLLRQASGACCFDRITGSQGTPKHPEFIITDRRRGKAVWRVRPVFQFREQEGCNSECCIVRQFVSRKVTVAHGDKAVVVDFGEELLKKSDYYGDQPISINSSLFQISSAAKAPWKPVVFNVDLPRVKGYFYEDVAFFLGGKQTAAHKLLVTRKGKHQGRQLTLDQLKGALKAFGRKPEGKQWYTYSADGKANVMFVDDPSVTAARNRTVTDELTFLWPVLLADGCGVTEPALANFAGLIAVCRLTVVWKWDGAVPDEPDPKATGCLIDLGWW